MKSLIAVSSCLRDKKNGCHQAMVDTWMNNLPIDCRVFLGQGNTAEGNEVVLECPDDYLALPLKTKLSLQWARDHGYTHVFRAFTDTYIEPDRLWHSGFEQHPYLGFFGGERRLYNYASGGAGYWTGAKLSDLCIAAEVGNEWAEDRWVGKVAGDAGICCNFDGRYVPRGGRVLKGNDTITVHLSKATGNYDKQWMYDCHEAYLRSR